MSKNFVDFPCVFQKYSSMQKKLAIREGASITIFRQTVLSRSTESFRRGILGFRKFRVSKNFMLMRRISGLSMEKFLFHRTETFRREPISVLLTSSIKNISHLGGFCQVFLFKKRSGSTESFGRGKLLCFRKLRVSKKRIPKRGISRTSMENLLSHSTESFHRGILLCFRKFQVSKRNYAQGGNITLFYRKFFASLYRKLRGATH